MQHTSIPHPSPPSCAPWPSHPNVPTLSCSLPYIYVFFLPRAETSVTHSPHVRPRVQTAPGHLRCRLHQTQRASSAQAETAAANHVSSKAEEKIEEEGTTWLFFPLSFSFSRSCNCNWRDGHRSNHIPRKKKATQQSTATVSNKVLLFFFFTWQLDSYVALLPLRVCFIFCSALMRLKAGNSCIPNVTCLHSVALYRWKVMNDVRCRLPQ